MKNKLLKLLCSLTFCFGFIASSQAGLITTYNPEDVNDNIRSDAIQDWFSIDLLEKPEYFTLSFMWKDQGWGNRKGRLFYRTDNMNWQSFGLLAEHKYTSHDITVNANQFNVTTLPNSLDFGYIVGGGGGHRLLINNATLTVQNANNAGLSVAAANVPEPSTLAIFALAVIGLAARRFQK